MAKGYAKEYAPITYVVTFKIKVDYDYSPKFVYSPKFIKEDILQAFPEAKAIKVTKDG